MSRVLRVALVPALVAVAGCQSYEPRPLSSAEHRAAWHARTLEDGSLAGLLERIDRDLGEEVGEFDAADGLSLREGRLVALVFNPGLRLARLRVREAAVTSEHAGLWEDPRFSVDLLRITKNVPSPWVVTPGLAFSLPLSGRLGAERGIADAAHRAAELLALEAEWTVWHEVRKAWFEWSAALLRVDETERFVGTLEAFVQTTSQLAETGELPRTEASLFLVERAQRQNRLHRLRGDVAVAEQRLRALLGLAPEAPVTFVPSLALAGASSKPEENPTLARLREEYQVAEETLRREILEQVPDLALGPLFESDAGQSRVGFLGEIPLPLLNANRQAIAQARVAREIARAAFETKYESLVGRRAAVGASVAALREQRVEIEDVLAPLVDGQLADAAELMRLGEGTSLVLLESLTHAHEIKLELIATRLAEALARAEFDHLTGPLTDVKEDTP